MTPEEKRSYDERMQAALADVQAVIEKHGCLVFLDPTEACLVVSLHTNPETTEGMKDIAKKRWRTTISSAGKPNPDYIVRSPEMERMEVMKQKLQKLQATLDPMDMMQVMMRLASGEDPETILNEYQGKVDEHEARIKDIDDDPRKLLADLDFEDKPEEPPPFSLDEDPDFGM